VARDDPALILKGKKRPVLIAGWPEVPTIWDVVRSISTRAQEKGQYLLTGSQAPWLGSLVSGRTATDIGRVHMRTLSLYESGQSSGAISLSKLFSGTELKPAFSKLSPELLVEYCVRGGWPEAFDTSQPQIDAGIPPGRFIAQAAKTDLAKKVCPRRTSEVLAHVLAAVARINSPPVTHKSIVDDVQSRFGGVTRQTIDDCLAVLRRLYVIELIEPWSGELKRGLQLNNTPKLILADPSLAVSALRARPAYIAGNLHILGGLFENLVLRDLLIYAESIGATVRHYHDAKGRGLEIPAIVELGSQWAGFEINLDDSKIDEAADNLTLLRGRLQHQGIPSPTFLCVISSGRSAYVREDDGVFVVPIDCLAP